MISFATSSDCYNLSCLSTQVWLETYAKEGITEEHSEYVLSNLTPQVFESLLDSVEHRVIVAKNNRSLVGLAVINLASQFNSQSHGFEIERLYIHPSFRQCGYGRSLLAFISKEVGETFWLYTWVENASNTFYERLGFQKIGEHSFYFDEQEVENNVYAVGGT